VHHKYAESTMSDTEREKNEPRSLSDEEKTERKVSFYVLNLNKYSR